MAREKGARGRRGSLFLVDAKIHKSREEVSIVRLYWIAGCIVHRLNDKL